jgi:hypothetical protein
MSRPPDKVSFALVGGQAVILQGVERTTIDVDFCLYSDLIHAEGSPAFHAMVRKRLPEWFSARLIQGSKFPDDPFKHDVIFIDDTKGEYVRIDLLIALYKMNFFRLFSPTLSAPGSRTSSSPEECSTTPRRR